MRKRFGTDNPAPTSRDDGSIRRGNEGRELTIQPTEVVIDSSDSTDLAVRSNIGNPRSGIPTPLYVTQQGKSIVLKFNTQEEADVAARYLSALAAAHADATHAAQLECDHEITIVRLKGMMRTKCTKCGLII